MTSRVPPAARGATRVHPSRVRWLRAGAPVSGARFVLYWVQINQRSRFNQALDFAIAEADALGLPVVVYQGLRPDYPGANDRLHTFILEGAVDLARGLAARRIRHLFHLERRPSAAGGLIAALARDAAIVVTDHFPTFIVPAQSRALARQLERPFAVVDASCIAPLALFPRPELAARTFRPKIHRVLPEHLVPAEERAPRRSSLRLDLPYPHPAAGLEREEREWLDLRAPKIDEWVASCAIDHRIAPSPLYRGGENEARRRLRRFVDEKLARYPGQHDDPARDGTSRLSPYLHFGQISDLEAALEVLAGPGGREPPRRERGADLVGRGATESRPSALLRENKLPEGSSRKRARPAPGHRLDPAALTIALRAALLDRTSPAGAFLEQLIVRRGLAFQFCETHPRHDDTDALPAWARRTLEDHAGDPRLRSYDAKALEWSETDDEVWNAAQTELRLTGVIHDRLRMIWGKKILEWTESPAEAMRIMIDLHERYALDGRDPNTYANVLWCLGLHDRPFGPARPVLGTVRPMSTAIARRKFDFASYAKRLRDLEEYGVRQDHRAGEGSGAHPMKGSPLGGPEKGRGPRTHRGRAPAERGRGKSRRVS